MKRRRREFSIAVQVEIKKRATRDGVRYCEKCGDQAMRGDVHHKRQDAMEVDKSSRLTADDGLYLCVPCHKVESKFQSAELALVLAQEAYHFGARKPGKIKVRRRKNRERLPYRPPAGQTQIARRFQ